jgi:threonine/homoserine/homoserine lactone efflux protein
MTPTVLDAVHLVGGLFLGWSTTRMLTTATTTKEIP